MLGLICYSSYCCCLVTESCLTLCPSWTVTHQAPLSMEFSRQEYWSWLPFPSPGNLPDPGIEPRSPAFTGRFFFTTRASWEVPSLPIYLVYFSSMLCHESDTRLWKTTRQTQVPGKKVVEGSSSGLKLPGLCLGFITYWLPRWHNGKESACQCRRCKRCRFSPWVGKILWRRKWQPTPVFLPGKGKRNLAGCHPWGYITY